MAKSNRELEEWCESMFRRLHNAENDIIILSRNIGVLSDENTRLNNNIKEISRIIQSLDALVMGLNERTGGIQNALTKCASMDHTSSQTHVLSTNIGELSNRIKMLEKFLDVEIHYPETHYAKKPTKNTTKS